MGKIGRVNRHTGVQRFADPGDETSGTDQIAKSRGEFRTVQYRRTCGGDQSNREISRKERSSIVKSRTASHIYRRLVAYGLRVFWDPYELQQGDNMTAQVEGAIRTASVHVAIFTPTYAESSWCLDELVLMLESGSTIIPVFYKVEPLDLRWTRGGDGV